MKKIIPFFIATLFSISANATCPVFVPNTIIYASAVTAAIAAPCITGGSVANVPITNSPISGSTGSFTSLAASSVSVTSGLTAGGTVAASSVSATNDLTIGGTAAASAVSVTNGLTANNVSVTNLAVNGMVTNNLSVSGTLSAPTIAASTVNASGTVSGGSFSGAGTGITGTAASLNIGGNAATASAVNNTATSKLPSLTATVAANALTINASPVYLDFRSATSASGIPSTVLAAPAALVVPASAVLGTIAGNVEHLMVLELNNAGTAELAIVNLSGGVDLDEEDVISTTAISAGSAASNVVYSTTSRTNVPYRVIGSLEITEATPGAWATAPSNIAGIGAGNVYMSLHSFGYGQNWQDVTASRTSGTPYYNQTNRPIEVMLTVGGISTITVSVNGVTLTTGHATNVDFTVQPGQTYTGTSTSSSFTNWAELR